jgi:hypothetical protein
MDSIRSDSPQKILLSDMCSKTTAVIVLGNGKIINEWYPILENICIWSQKYNNIPSHFLNVWAKEKNWGSC